MPALTRSLVFALLAASLLVACAPTTLGERSSPYRLGRDGPASAQPGGEVYVEVDVARDVFGLVEADLSPRWQPWSVNLARAVATHRFIVRDVIAPDGWELSLNRAVAWLRSNRSEVDIELLLRLQVPADARLGGHRVRASIVDQNGRSLPLEIVVQVGR